MATELDNDLREAALELLTEFGQTPTLYQSVTKGTFNVTSDRVSGNSVTTRTGFKVAPPQILTEGLIERRGFGASTGQPLVTAGDAITYVAATDISGWDPNVGDRIQFLAVDGQWEAIRVIPLVSGEQVAAWEIIVRVIKKTT